MGLQWDWSFGHFLLLWFVSRRLQPRLRSSAEVGGCVLLPRRPARVTNTGRGRAVAGLSVAGEERSRGGGERRAAAWALVVRGVRSGAIGRESTGRAVQVRHWASFGLVVVRGSAALVAPIAHFPSMSMRHHPQ